MCLKASKKHAGRPAHNVFRLVFNLIFKISSVLWPRFVGVFIQGNYLLNKKINTYSSDSISSLGVWFFFWWAATLAYRGVPILNQSYLQIDFVLLKLIFSQVRNTLIFQNLQDTHCYFNLTLYCEVWDLDEELLYYEFVQVF